MINKLKLRVLSMLVVIILIIIAGWLLTRKKQEEKTWRLPDGSVLSLEKVTYGTKHQVRYENRWQDFVAPVLPAKLQTKLGAKLATHTSSSSNGIVMWLWQKKSPPTGTTIAGSFRSPTHAPTYRIVTVDSDGLESLPVQTAGCWIPSPNAILDLWELRSYPRRDKEIGIKVYGPDALGKWRPVAQFAIENKFQIKTGGWQAEALPATRTTNGLEVTLLKLETGLTQMGNGLSAGENAKSFSRAIFKMRDGAQSESWSVIGIRASAASDDDARPAGGYTGPWLGKEQTYTFAGPLSLQEPAWKLRVEVSRTKDFPAEELWIIRGVPVPEAGKVVEINATTNIYGAEIVFQGISAAKAKLPQEWARTQPFLNLHASNPIPISDTNLRLVEVRDNLGNIAKLVGDTWGFSTGGRGATLKEMNHGFGIEVPEGTKSLDVTFAFSKSRYVEFLAKPMKAKD